MIALALAAALSGAPAQPHVERTLRDPRVDESSGLVVSGRRSDVLWTSNDGPEGRLYAIGPDGRTLATYRLAGVKARDWEALAPGRDEQRQPAVYVGDIGDNSASRTGGILVHRMSEPARLTDATLPATSYRLRYPDGPHNAEALLVDPRTGRLYVVTKTLLAGAVYAAPERLDPAAPNLLQRVAGAPGLVTDGSFLPDGRVVLRGYGSAYLFDRLGGDAEEFALPEQPQGESLAALPAAQGGREAVLAGSEGVGSAVWRVPLPGSDAASVAGGGSGSSAAAATGGSTAGAPVGSVRWLAAWTRWTPWLPAGVLVAVLLVVGVRRLGPRVTRRGR